MLQGTEDHVLCANHCLRSGRVPDSDGELLQASRDLLRRQDLVLLSSDELWWYRGSGCSRSRPGGEGSSAAAEGRSRSGSEGLISFGIENAE